MVQIFALNNSVEPLNNLKVRQAINYAVSRKDVISVTMDGAGVELTTAMSPAMGSYYDKSLDGTFAQDIEKAKELLAEAGYENGFNITCTVPSSYLIHVNTPYDVLDRYQSASSGNFINYKNDKVDELMAKIPTITDTKEKTELYHQVLKLLTDDACSVYLQDPTTITAVSTRLEGYNVYPMYVQDMSQVKVTGN